MRQVDMIEPPKLAAPTDGFIDFDEQASTDEAFDRVAVPVRYDGSNSGPVVVHALTAGELVAQQNQPQGEQLPPPEAPAA